MTIASAITAAQGRVADCYTSVNTMGGTLPATQDLTNLPSAIESIPTGGGGGDTIYLPNESGATINAGDKVLFTMGATGSSTPDTFTTDYTTSNRFASVCILDNSSFIISGYASNENGYLFTKVNETWTQGAKSTNYANAGYGVYHYFSDYINSYNEIQGSDIFSRFVTAAGTSMVAGNTYRKYAGYYNNSHYVSASSSTTYGLYKWNTSDNTLTSVLSISSLSPDNGFSRIYGNRLIATGGNRYYIYSMTDDVTLTQLSTGTIATDLKMIEATGLERGLVAGDIVFAVNNYNAEYSGYQMTGESNLYCYEVQSDSTLAYKEIPELKIFENTPCYVAYDNRSNILSIGTKDEVYFYEFDTTTKDFTRINISHSILPTPAGDIPLKTQMMPDKGTFVVYARSATANAVYVYSLTTVGSSIVPNSQYYYDLVTSFTGIATGETDEDGNYEINTVLPPIVESKIITDLEPDEVIIKGGAE